MSDTAFRRRVDAVRQNALAQHQHTSKPSRAAERRLSSRREMFVIKKKSAKKSSEEWLSVKTNFLYLGGYFACVRLAYEVCSRLR